MEKQGNNYLFGLDELNYENKDANVSSLKKACRDLVGKYNGDVYAPIARKAGRYSISKKYGRFGSYHLNRYYDITDGKLPYHYSNILTFDKENDDTVGFIHNFRNMGRLTNTNYISLYSCYNETYINESQYDELYNCVERVEFKVYCLIKYIRDIVSSYETLDKICRDEVMDLGYVDLHNYNEDIVTVGDILKNEQTKIDNIISRINLLKGKYVFFIEPNNYCSLIKMDGVCEWDDELKCINIKGDTICYYNSKDIRDIIFHKNDYRTFYHKDMYIIGEDENMDGLIEDFRSYAHHIKTKMDKYINLHK